MTVFESLLNHDFTVSRRQRSPDGQGGWVISYAAAGTVRGRIRPSSSTERISAQSEEREITHVLYVKADADVQRGDQVVGDGLTVEVLAVREPSRAGEHLEIDCEERQLEISQEEDGGS